MRKIPLSIIAALAVVGVAGCGGGSGGDVGETASTKEAVPFRLPSTTAPQRLEKEVKPNAAGLAGPEPKAVIPNLPPPEFLVLKDLIEGIGNMVHAGQRAAVQFVGYEYETGKKFVSSWDIGKPVTFTLGKGEVIPAWEEGVEGMEVGDRREMVVPPDLTQGPYPAGIPKGKAVVFVVELLPQSAVSKAESASSPAAQARSKPAAG